MLLPGLHSPWRAATLSIGRSSSQAGHLHEAFAQLALRSTPIGLTFVRHASHNQQSSHSQKKDGPGKRLGAKKSGEQYVIPGNIIFRQRGTKWFPGENCGMGRDHTIFSKVHGYVKYYKDPLQHPKRQYIGVAFERDHVLPYDRREPRHRRLGMFTEKIDSEVAGKLLVDEPGDAIDVVKATKSKERRGEEGRNLTLKSGYMYREANWEIGRAAERAQVIVPPFKPGDRWTAWRKSTTRKAKNAEKRVGRSRSKKKK